MNEQLERNEDEVLSGEGIAINIGGREYLLKPRKGLATGKKVREAVDPLISDVRGFIELVKACFASGLNKFDSDNPEATELSLEAFGDKELSSMTALAKIAFGSDIFKFINLAIDYFPCLDKDREWLETEGATTKDFIPILIYMGVYEYGPFVTQVKQLISGGVKSVMKDADQTKSGKD